jgi:hypothetical protein
MEPMQPMQWQEHKKCSNPSPLNSTKATNAMRIYERKNNGENQQMNPRSRSNSFPHKVGSLISENIDLDLLSLFPQQDAKIIRGIES